MIGVKVDKNNNSKNSIQKKSASDTKSKSAPAVTQLCGEKKVDDKKSDNSITSKDSAASFEERSSFWSNETIQGKFSDNVKQLKSAPSFPIVQLKNNNTAPIQRATESTNKTGLPNNVKSNIETISKVSLDDVKVHYNSNEPAQLRAHAFAQGTDIHVGPGQEKHVPHEAWHVVQQKQGRVKATTQLKGQVPINDDEGLEREADIMGAKAVQMVSIENEAPVQQKEIGNNKVAQLNPFSWGPKEKPEKSVKEKIDFFSQVNPIFKAGGKDILGKGKPATVEPPRDSVVAPTVDAPTTSDSVVAPTADTTTTSDSVVAPIVDTTTTSDSVVAPTADTTTTSDSVVAPTADTTTTPAASQSDEKIKLSKSDKLLMKGGSAAMGLFGRISPIWKDEEKEGGKKSWLNNVGNAFFGEKKEDTGKREGGWLSNVSNSFFGEKKEDTGKREGGWLSNVSNSFFGEKKEETGKREGGWLNNVSNSFFGEKKDDTGKREGGWLNNVSNSFFGEKKDDTGKREGGWLNKVSNSFFGEKKDDTGKREGGWLNNVSNSFFGEKKDDTGKREGGWLNKVSNSFFGEKKDDTGKREGGWLNKVSNSFFGEKKDDTGKREGGIVNKIWDGTKKIASDSSKWGDEDFDKVKAGGSKWNYIPGLAKKAAGYVGGLATYIGGGLITGGAALAGGIAAGGTALAGGLSAGGTALAGGLAAGGTALAGGVAAGGTALAGGVAAGGTALAGGIAAGGTALAGGVAAGGTALAGGIAAGGTALAGGVAAGGTILAGSASSIGLATGGLVVGTGTLLGKGALHYGSIGLNAAKGIFSPEKYSGADHAKYGDKWDMIDKKHHDQMKKNPDHEFAAGALPKGFHADGRENYGETNNRQKASYVSRGIGGILNFSNLISKKAGVGEETLRNVGASAGTFGALGSISSAYSDGKEGLNKGTSTSTKVKAAADVALDVTEGVSSFSSLMTTAEHAANMSGMFSIITGSLEIVRGAIGAKNASDRKASSNSVLIQVLDSMCKVDLKEGDKPLHSTEEITKMVQSNKAPDKEAIANILRNYKGPKAGEYHELAIIADDVSKLQDRNSNTAFGQIAKGALAVAGGAVLLALGGAAAASPVGWVLLGAAAVAGIGMLYFNYIAKGKSIKQIAIRELNVDPIEQEKWDKKHDETNSIWKKFTDGKKTHEDLTKQGISPLERKLREYKFSNIDHFYSNYMNATSHKIVYEAYVMNNKDYENIVEGLGFKTKDNIDKSKPPKADDPLFYYPTAKQIAKQLNN